MKLHKEVLCIVCVVRCAKKCAASYISGSQTLVCHNVLCHVTREVAFRKDWAVDVGNCDLGNLHLVLLSLDPTALMTWR